MTKRGDGFFFEVAVTGRQGGVGRALFFSFLFEGGGEADIAAGNTNSLSDDKEGSIDGSGRVVAITWSTSNSSQHLSNTHLSVLGWLLPRMEHATLCGHTPQVHYYAA